MEVQKDYCIEMSVYGRHLLVSPAVDVIHRFTENQYDHLKYVDPEHRNVSCLFLGQAALSELVCLKVSQTRQRQDMMQTEYDEWIQWHAEESGLFTPEEPQPLTDEEISYYLDEWTK